jgi:CheY-like chemotaxis protein
MKVLIIDDEDDIRRVARLSLVKLGGLEVIEASNGPDGLRRAAEDRPDAILLDVMMPAMDGLHTLQALRADPATAAIPVVFLTAKALAPELGRLKALPDLDGYDVVSSLKGEDGLRSIPLLVYTGRDLSGEQRRRLQLGPTRFVTKSRVTDNAFRDLVLEMLEGKEAQP